MELVLTLLASQSPAFHLCSISVGDRCEAFDLDRDEIGSTARSCPLGAAVTITMAFDAII